MANQWKGYVNHLIKPGQSSPVTKAAIIGQAGGVWDKSDNLEFKPGEENAIINLFKNPEEAQASGVRVGGDKFFMISSQDPSQIFNGKKGADGCVIVKTNQAIVVAVYQAPAQQQECLAAVETFASYLRENKY